MEGSFDLDLNPFVQERFLRLIRAVHPATRQNRLFSDNDRGKELDSAFFRLWSTRK